MNRSRAVHQNAKFGEKIFFVKQFFFLILKKYGEKIFSFEYLSALLKSLLNQTSSTNMINLRFFLIP